MKKTHQQVLTLDSFVYTILSMNSKDIVSKLLALALTQSEIARLSGISQPTISRLSNGKHKSSDESTYHALRALLDQLQRVVGRRQPGDKHGDFNNRRT